MLEIISAAVDHLRAEGFSKGSRIAVCSENRIESYLLTLACWKMGAVIVPVSTRYPNPKFQIALESINCRDLFTSKELTKTLAGCRSFLLEDFFLCREYETAPLIFEQFQFDPAAGASILFTSGSSGTPKGVLHTIGNHYYNALGAIQTIPFERGDRWLMSLPMYHVSGFSLIMRSLIRGGKVVFPQTGESIKDALLHKDITHLSLVPAQLNTLMQDPDAVQELQRCRSILLGGAASGLMLIQRALDHGLLLSTTYGLTETASQVTTTDPQTLKQRLNVSGRILPHRELKIDDDGEILVKGPTLFKGYVNRDKVQLPLDEQGYFHTGDLGVLDKDEILTVFGRKDRMFISGGENIYPEEIEKALLADDSIQRACVVPVKNEVMGARPVAFVKTTLPLTTDTADTLALNLRSCLEGFKVPIAFHPWPKSQPGDLKPDIHLFQRIAMENNTQEL